MSSIVHSRTRQAVLLLLMALVLGVCGCGGNSDTTTRSAATTRDSAAADASTEHPGSGAVGSSAPQFIAQADAICARINHEISAIKAKSGSAVEVIRVVPLTVSVERRGIEMLEGLHVPGPLARDWQRMLGYRRTLLSELDQLLELAKSNDGTSIKPLAASKRRVHTALAKTARSHGFKDCAKVGSAG